MRSECVCFFGNGVSNISCCSCYSSNMIGDWGEKQEGERDNVHLILIKSSRFFPMRKDYKREWKRKKRK